MGVYRGCGACTQPRNGKGDGYAYCKACHPGAIERRWTPERVLAAVREWRSRNGKLPSSHDPSSHDWSRPQARPQARPRVGERWSGWPAASVVTRLLGTWAMARATLRRQY